MKGSEINIRIFCIGLTTMSMQQVHAQQCKANTKPNILFIMADDLGYNDLSSYGGQIPTPNIDAIGKNGIRFSNFYTCASTSTPSRFGLLTGRYPAHSANGLLNPLALLDPADSHKAIQPHETTIASALKQQGYSTALIGKWHLGHGKKEFLPTHHGFDYFSGFTAGAVDFFTSNYGLIPNWYIGDTISPVLGYSTDVLTDEAIRYLKNQDAEKPFFLFLSYNAPHFGKPWNAQKNKAVDVLQAKPEDIARFVQLKDTLRREYAAMVAALDDGVGRVLMELQKQELDSNTLVVFMSDNGGSIHHGGSNVPLRGQKTTLFEGGIRVPCLISWKGHIQSNKTVHCPATNLDWFPTLLSVTESNQMPDSLAGNNLQPLFNGKVKSLSNRQLLWFEKAAQRDGGAESAALRLGNWKLLRTGGKDYLFNLNNDISEKTDLSKSKTKQLLMLQQKLNTWLSNNYPNALVNK